MGLDLWVSPPSNHPLDFFKTTFDFVAMVPSQLEASIPLLNCCRKVLIGGAPLIGSLKRKAVLAVQTEPTELFLSYGMTEIKLYFHYCPISILRRMIVAA